ncbi:MAG: 3-deoxy-manno-octulosonate cytidylyltransferase [Dehalococcoidia bacterium]
MTAIVAIPARLKSSRFPGKVLADLRGRPMLWHVWQGVAQARTISQVWVLTDSREVYDLAISWGAKALMTSEECPSGTDRIASVASLLEADIIVNVQADEPLITGAVVDAVVRALEGSNCDVATPAYPIQSLADVTNPNVVKVVRGTSGNALYFSRSPIPYVRDGEWSDWLNLVRFWGHVGVYGYRREVLLQYSGLPQGKLEKAESLEQLRLLEAGLQIAIAEIDYHPHAVDVPADLEVVKEILDARLSPT